MSATKVEKPEYSDRDDIICMAKIAKWYYAKTANYLRDLSSLQCGTESESIDAEGVEDAMASMKIRNSVVYKRWEGVNKADEKYKTLLAWLKQESEKAEKLRERLARPDHPTEDLEIVDPA